MTYQDLLKDTSKPDPSNSNYFLVTVTDLEANQSYPIQFRWKYNDGTFSPWSAVRVVTTPGESSPNTPRFAATNVDTTTPGFLKITWDGNSDDNAALTDIDRVDVYISGAPFVGNVVAATFKTAGTQSIAVPGGTYQIVLYAVSKLGKLSPVSAAVTKTIAGVSNPLAAPENPNVPTITAGLASVIVSWNGKQSDGTSDFSAGAFASAKVYIGTSAGFVPSDNNWVHSLNFANGTNQVSIGVGTVIDKALGTKLQYGVPYYVKIKTVNAAVPPVETATAVASSPTNVTVDKVAASEIVTGTLEAGAYITAGISGGARAVLSGSSEPLVIYGSNGTTKLLEFSSTNPATLTVNGGGTFTGDLSIGSGNSIFKSDSYGIYLGNATESLAPFSVSRNGILRAQAGTIGGWTLGGTYFQNASVSPTIKIDTTGIIVGATSSAYIDITSSGITHRNSNGTASGKFTLTTGASAQLTIDGTFTISGSSTINGTAASTVVSNASAGSTAVQGGNGVDKNVSNQITRISTNGGIVVSSSTVSSGARVELTNTGFYAYNGSGQETVSILASNGNATFRGTVTGSSLNVTGENFAINQNNDADGLAPAVSTISNAFASTYIRQSINCVGFNAIAFTSVNTAGVLSAWYPFYDADVDLGVKYSSTAGAGPFRWRNGRLSGSLMIGGDGSTDTPNTNGVGPYTRLYGDGRIYANTLGTGTGTTLVQSGGFIRVSSSSLRYKENVISISQSGAIETIKKLRPVTFNYKEEFAPTDYEIIVSGLIAEDVDQIEELRTVVNYNDQGLPESISYDRLTAHLVLAVKEISEKLNSIESRLDALEG